MEACSSGIKYNDRITLHTDDCDRLFDELLLRELTVELIAKRLGVSSRSVRDWRRRKFTIPAHHFYALIKLAKLSDSDIRFSSRSQWQHTSVAGKAGGAAYIKKYGSIGSSESRALGGLNSYNLRKSSKKDIFARRDFRTPGPSPQLAEFVGIMIGDGTVGKYQISIALDMITDKIYADFVASLVEDLFHIRPGVYLREKQGRIVIAVSSVALSEYLQGLGLLAGNKLRYGVTLPGWVRNNPEFSKACLRGLFDTDGSVYQETHRLRNAIYSYPRLSLVSYSKPLRDAAYDELNRFGISALIRNDRDVKIERFTDIKRYFTVIGTSNGKHLARWHAYGGVG